MGFARALSFLITYGNPFLSDTHFFYNDYRFLGFDNFFPFNPWEEKSQ